MPDCCKTWDNNAVISETHLMSARLDAHPVTPGHTLIIPRRHVDKYADLTRDEMGHAFMLMAEVCDMSDADDFTIAVNDGPAAGRTIHHLHIHVIPRRPGDIPHPRGGIRRLFIPNETDDPWTQHLKQEDHP